jgi:hypothetical protein
MNKSKVDFIADLLSEKRLDASDKEKLFQLAFKELRNLETTDEDLRKKVEALEEKINGEGNGRTKSLKKENENYHNPQKVLGWLQLFTQNDSDIKFSTHLWDDLGRYETINEFFSKINENWKYHKFSILPNYNHNLYYEKVYPFLFQRDLTRLEKDPNEKKEFGWGRGDQLIKIGWQYPNIIKEWCANHFDEKTNKKTPFEMEVPNNVLPSRKIHGIPIKYFEDVVEVFKKEIEFRDNDLYYRIKRLVKKRLSEFNIDENALKSLKGHSFFTNTEYVEKSIDRILYHISKRTENPEVKIYGSITMDKNYFVLEIVHKGSFSDKLLNNNKIQLNKDSGDMLYILRRTLQSLCDYAIESRFREIESGELVSYRIHYLYNGVEEQNWQPFKEKMDKGAEGFKHILNFPL